MSRLADRVDLLVIGGGINGAAIARDAALRGLRVCLVDAGDWGAGTSAKSSMLAHGGLRYLEQFELGLVHEALQDRERLFAQAPHLVRPLRFLYPIYPEIANRRTVRVGMWLYDVLSHGKTVPRRAWHRADEVLTMAPALEGEGLKGAASYTDGQIQSVERLVLEHVADAKAHGAVCHNHARLVRLLIDDVPGPGGPERRCQGAVIAIDGQQVEVHARAVINAAGTWVDDVLGSLAEGKPPKVRKTKGVHVAVPRFVDVAFIIRARDGRVFFVLPWQEHCLIGTTDTDYQGDARDAVATTEDVTYLLDSARAYFPDADLSPRFTYAGVRALVNQEGLTESNVTRRHILYDHGRMDGVARLWSLQGGKITTARSLAEECVDIACRAIGRGDLAKVHPTRRTTLPGGPLVPWDVFRRDAVATAVAEGLPAASAAHVVDTYGARWRHVIDADARPEGRTRIDKALPHLWCEVAFAIQEDAATVADVMLRRTHMGLAHDGRPRVAARVARRMAELLRWDRARRHAELDAYAREVRVLAVPSLTF